MQSDRRAVCGHMSSGGWCFKFPEVVVHLLMQDPAKNTGDGNGEDSLVVVHLSDFHFGDDPFNKRFDERRAGFYGHDYAFALALREGLLQAAADAGVRYRDLRVVVSGDLTKCGTARQLTFANKFLHGTMRDPLATLTAISQPFGLDLEKMTGHRAVVIPGNHDHWAGELPTPWWKQETYQPGAFSGEFGTVPWDVPKRLSSSGGGIVLELLGLDSNSGLSWGATNSQAGGEVSQEHLLRLTGFAKAPPDGTTLDRLPDGSLPVVVRWLLIHHDFGHRSFASFFSGEFQPKPLRSDSREAVLLKLRTHSIAMVLTGHQHIASAQRHVGGRLTELRAPAATAGQALNQVGLSRAEARLRAQLAGLGFGLAHNPNREGQETIPVNRCGFWVHTLRRAAPASQPAQGRRVVCESRLYLWLGTVFRRVELRQHYLWSTGASAIVSELPVIAAAGEPPVGPPVPEVVVPRTGVKPPTP